MPIGMPGDIQTLGIGELSRVSVRRPDPDVDIGAALHRDAAQRRVLRRPSVAELVGAFDPKEFLNCALDQLGVIANLRISSGLRIKRSTPLPMRLVVVSCRR